MPVQFEFDPAACSACQACSVACMDLHDIDVAGGQAPYRKVSRREEGRQSVYLSVACLHCADAPCVRVCPQHCLRKDAITGLTLLDNSRCIGCRACARVCPVDAPTFRPTGLARPAYRMEKCCGCLPLLQAGLCPACVAACPVGALRVHAEL